MKCYGFAIGNGYGMRFKEYTDILSNVLEDAQGLIGVHPDARGTLLVFHDYDDAIKTRNLFEYYNLPTGRNIMECEYEDDTLTVMGIYERERS